MKVLHLQTTRTPDQVSLASFFPCKKGVITVTTFSRPLDTAREGQADLADCGPAGGKKVSDTGSQP